MDDAPLKFDTSEENFEVGGESNRFDLPELGMVFLTRLYVSDRSTAAWFDVQRDGKIGYHEAQVVELDFDSNVKRVKFHFYKLSSDRDEWVDVGSPRIAPHVSAASLLNCESIPNDV